LFAKLQYETATAIGVDPVVTVSANVSGGVVGKMISPQSIAVAAAAGQLVGKESDLFRFTVKHSFFMLILICCIVLSQAYAFQWLIPTYRMLNAGTVLTVSNVPLGFVYLLICGVILGIFSILVRMVGKQKIGSAKAPLHP
jgi:lactate permease